MIYCVNFLIIKSVYLVHGWYCFCRSLVIHNRYICLCRLVYKENKCFCRVRCGHLISLNMTQEMLRFQMSIYVDIYSWSYFYCLICRTSDMISCETTTIHKLTIHWFIYLICFIVFKKTGCLKRLCWFLKLFPVKLQFFYVTICNV